MKEIPKISDSEWEIMKIVWAKKSVTCEEIVASLPSKTHWTSQTVKTFLNRLLKKGVLDYEKMGRNYIYRPIFSEEECQIVENHSFLERVYGGAIGLLFSNFLEHESLQKEDIERLQRMLEEKKNKGR